MDIADRLEAAADRFIAYVEGIDEQSWTRTTDAEGWPIGVAAHHLAVSGQFVMDLAEHVSQGGDITWTREFIDSANEQHAEAFADVSKQEALENVTHHLREAVRRTRQMTDEDLTRPLAEPWDYPFSERYLHNAAEVIEVMIIDHIESHLGSIQQATA